jgi:hypothetical protein
MRELNMSRRKRLFWIVPAAILGIALFIFIGGEIVMHLWNWLLPPLFGFRPVTFWQGVGLLALCRILFGGHGWRGPGRSRLRRRMEERMSERWEHMTPEERERFRQSWRGRCGFGPSSGESKEQPSS